MLVLVVDSLILVVVLLVLIKSFLFGICNIESVLDLEHVLFQHIIFLVLVEYSDEILVVLPRYVHVLVLLWWQNPGGVCYAV